MNNKRRLYSVALGVTASSVALWAGAPGAWANSGGASSPAGNNGTIKIDQYVVDSGNDNDPHVTCGFSVSFFGFDSGQQKAAVTVTPWAPTTGGSPYHTTDTWTTTSRTGGNQYDDSIHVSASDLSSALAGVTPNAQQGYHLKLETEVTGSRGSDDKYKVFWMQPCSTSSPSPASTSSGTSGRAPSTAANNSAHKDTGSSASNSGTTSSSATESAPSQPHYSALSSQLPSSSPAASSANSSATLSAMSPAALAGSTSPLATLGGLNTSPAASAAVVPAALGASRSSARVPVAMGGLNSTGSVRSAPSALAFTGADIASSAAGGLALIGLGTILTVRSRRRITS